MPSDWRAQFEQLVARNRKPADDGDFAACGRLAPKLSAAARVSPAWSASYVQQVLHRSKKVGPSPVFKMAVEKLYAQTEHKARHDKLRLYVPFESRDEIAYIEKHLSAGDRREILLAAASHEDFEE